MIRFYLSALSLAVCIAVSTSFPASAAGAVALFDEGHGQRFVTAKTGELDLSSLAGRFEKEGFEIRRSTGPLTADLLSSADALVISGPFAGYGKDEVEAVAAFLERGGKLAIMLHIGQPLMPLLERIGVDYSNRAIHDNEGAIDGKDMNFRVTRLEPGPLTQGLEHFSLYGAWAVVCTGEPCSPVASTSPTAWVDLDGDGKKSAGDAVQSFGVAVTGTVGNGRYVVFGDDAMFQNKFLDEANGKLADNLARWMR